MESKSPKGFAPQTLTILFSIPQTNSTANPYTALLAKGLETLGVKVEWYKRVAVLFQTPSVIHFQWPESLLRGRSAFRRALLAAHFLLWLAIIRIRNIPIVQTLHNVKPHESGSQLEKFLLTKLNDQTSAWITLNSHTPKPEHGRVILIPHGHYKDWYPGSIPSRVSRQSGFLLFFGLIRPYKGLDSLVHAFNDYTRQYPQAPQLIIAGEPQENSISPDLKEQMACNEKVKTILKRVDDETLASLLRSARLVVLPYRQLNNSGAVLLALSLGAPLLLPSCKASHALRQEFGADWIYEYEGGLDAGKLHTAYEKSGNTKADSSPDMSQRDWTRIANSHLALYKSLAKVHER